MLQLMLQKWKEKVVRPFLMEGDRWVCWAPVGIMMGIALADWYRLRVSLEIISGVIGVSAYAYVSTRKRHQQLKGLLLFFY